VRGIVQRKMRHGTNNCIIVPPVVLFSQPKMLVGLRWLHCAFPRALLVLAAAAGAAGGGADSYFALIEYYN
jgi:hypothetical protein